MKSALVKCLSSLPQELRKTITYDNGMENMLHEEINEKLHTKSFFVILIIAGRKGALKTALVCYADIFQRRPIGH